MSWFNGTLQLLLRVLFIASLLYMTNKHDWQFMLVVCVMLCIVTAFFCASNIEDLDKDYGREKMICCMVCMVCLSMYGSTITVQDCSTYLGKDTPTQQSIDNFLIEYGMCMMTVEAHFGEHSALHFTSDGKSRWLKCYDKWTDAMGNCDFREATVRELSCKKN